MVFYGKQVHKKKLVKKNKNNVEINCIHLKAVAFSGTNNLSITSAAEAPLKSFKLIFPNKGIKLARPPMMSPIPQKAVKIPSWPQ